MESSKIDDEKELRMRVRRLSIFEDACWKLNRIPANESGYRLKVVFANEEAIDEGGPTREFFR
jgi:hypothetical protein